MDNEQNEMTRKEREVKDKWNEDARRIIREAADILRQERDPAVEILDLKSKVADLQGKIERYEKMIQQAYVIEFWDLEKVIEKSGSYKSPTGILWSVRADEDESGKYISHHDSALEAFESMIKNEN